MGDFPVFLTCSATSLEMGTTRNGLIIHLAVISCEVNFPTLRRRLLSAIFRQTLTATTAAPAAPAHNTAAQRSLRRSHAALQKHAPNLSPAEPHTAHPHPARYKRDSQYIQGSRLHRTAPTRAVPYMSDGPATVLLYQLPRALPPLAATSQPPVAMQTAPRPGPQAYPPVANTQSPSEPSPAAECSEPLQVSHNPDRTSSSASVPFLFRAPAKAQYYACTHPPHS